MCLREIAASLRSSQRRWGAALVKNGVGVAAHRSVIVRPENVMASIINVIASVAKQSTCLYIIGLDVKCIL